MFKLKLEKKAQFHKTGKWVSYYRGQSNFKSGDIIVLKDNHDTYFVNYVAYEHTEYEKVFLTPMGDNNVRNYDYLPALEMYAKVVSRINDNT